MITIGAVIIFISIFIQLAISIYGNIKYKQIEVNGAIIQPPVPKIINNIQISMFIAFWIGLLILILGLIF